MMIYRIENSIKNRPLDFTKDVDLYDLMLLRFQVIGETIKQLPKEMLKEHSHVQWKIFIRFRNFISHHYFNINHNVLKKMIRVELPKLKKAIRKMNE